MDCIVIGESWKGPWIARLLAEQGARVQLLELDLSTTSFNRVGAIYVGFGEPRAPTELTFGKDIVDKLWDLSARNLARAKAEFARLQVPVREDRATWWAGDNKEQENSPALVFDEAVLAAKLCSNLAAGHQPTKLEAVTGIRRRAAFEYEVEARVNGKITAYTAKSVFIATESFPRGILDGLSEIWLPITLNRFSIDAAKSVGAVSLFHGGIDYAFQLDAARITVGSFRNLHEDRAYGLRPGWIDPVSEKNVTGYFHSLGWTKPDARCEREVFFESLSCDGLPLAGSLSAFPGVFLLGGFAGRTSNYFFELSSILSEGFSRGASAAELGLLAPKRLV